MNNPEDYLKSLLMQEDCEEAMDTIMNKYFEDTEVAHTTSASGNGTYYIMDPFPFMLFDNNGNVSHLMSEYCRRALDDYKSHKGSYRSLCFLPPYIKDTPILTIFSQITRNYIRGILSQSSINDNTRSVIEFYNLLNDPTVNKSDDDYVYTKFNSWNTLRTEISSNASHRIFVPEDIDSNGGYSSLKNVYNNIAYAPGVRMYYNNKIVPAMDIITNLAKNFATKKDSIHVESNVKDKTVFSNYVAYMIANCAFDISATTESVDNVKSRKAGKIKSEKISGRASSFDNSTYKNARLTQYDNDIDYWKDTTIGKKIDDINKTTADGADYWKKVVDDTKHTFNRKELDKDIEKFYNSKFLVPDALGLETTEARYDARKYEDPSRRKIKGVSGYDIYKNDLKIEKLEDEVNELIDEISRENDEDKIRKLQDKIDKNKEEIEILKQKLDSKEAHGERAEVKYKDKVSRLSKKGSVDESDIEKAKVFVSKEVSGIEQLKTNLVSN